MAKQAAKDVVDIRPIDTGSVRIFVVGTSPLVMNAMSEKVMQELLLPARKKTGGDKQRTLKHDPLAEFRRSCYLLSDQNAPTAICHMATAFKESMRNAALEIGGTTKAQMGRLTYVVGDRVPIFGVPQLFMSVVRQAGMNRTPDVRTRAILPQWAAAFTVNFVTPNLDYTSIVNLVNAAGMICGIGDGRPEKGKMSFGQFRVCDESDSTFQAVVQGGQREQQLMALHSPQFYDADTEELYAYFEAEVSQRTFERQSSVAFDRIWATEMEKTA